MFLLASVLAFSEATHTARNLTFPAIIGDNMVLQADGPAPIWGWTEPGRKVTVKFLNQTKSTTAGLDGKWSVRFLKLPKDQGGMVEVSDGTSNKTFTNVLVGEVYVCSGQSNMEWPLSAAKNGPDEVRRANYNRIRLFHVTKRADSFWEGDVQGKWEICTPQTAGSFSAVGYFFGRDLHETEQVPVGLIDTTWGGTPAEAWTPKDALLSNAVTTPLYRNFEKSVSGLQKMDPAILEQIKNRPERLTDTGNKGFAQGWHKPDFNASSWKPVKLPLSYDGMGLTLNGALWFRVEVNLGNDVSGKAVELNLGPIDDEDVTYVNGQQVGTMTAVNNPNVWMTPRKYSVPAGVFKPGKNVIAIRVFDAAGGGGFAGSPADMFLNIGGKKTSLATEWRYAIESSTPKMPVTSTGPNSPNSPVSLWAGMVKPLVPFGIRGAIWYQGESNAGRAAEYRTLFPTMIQGWRDAWGQGDFPFFFVQLANFMARDPNPSEDGGWAQLREAQTMTLSAKKNTGMAVIIDIGEEKDIHPRNKQDVGKRLAMSARAMIYKSEPAGNSPLYDRNTVVGSTMVISFKNAKGLRTFDGRNPVGFQIKGADNKWFWADAKIDGEKVVVSSPNVSKPTAVRYGWGNNPDVNVFNTFGLPMSPFRTDGP